jgi:hypothetical protein
MLKLSTQATLGGEVHVLLGLEVIRAVTREAGLAGRHVALSHGTNLCSAG